MISRNACSALAVGHHQAMPGIDKSMDVTETRNSTGVAWRRAGDDCLAGSNCTEVLNSNPERVGKK